MLTALIACDHLTLMSHSEINPHQQTLQVCLCVLISIMDSGCHKSLCDSLCVGEFECVPEHGAQDWFICLSPLGRGGCQGLVLRLFGCGGEFYGLR